MYRSLSLRHLPLALGLYLLLAAPPAAKAQAPKRLTMELRFGINCNLYNFNPFNGKRKQKFPGIRAFGSFIVVGEINQYLMTNYAASVSVYNKSLGNNLSPLVSDIQIDFINTVSIGTGWDFGRQGRVMNFDNNTVGYQKYLRTINNSPFYNLKHHYESALFLSTNFLINNHHRHQTVGSLSLSFGDFSLNYYNDGAPPISTFNLGDGFDRYWTGGLLLMGHSNEGFNRVELSFDQFTGYSPLVYELSNLLGIDIPKYEAADSTLKTKSAQTKARFSSASFNSSAYNLKIYFDPNYAFDIGVLGSLTKNETHFSLQDIIHINGRYSLHPNKDINRFYIGLTYNQSAYEN